MAALGILLLIVNVALSAGTFYFSQNVYSIQNTALEMQYAEVGGEQNFMKLHDIRKANNPAAVEDWIREQEGGSASQGSTNTQQAAPVAPDPAPEVLSQDDIAALKANAYIHGAE